jgi:hypothetical protein
LSFIRLKVRSKVVLPEPVGPMRAVTAPRRTSVVMPDKIARSPKLSVRSRVEITASPLGGEPRSAATVPVIVASAPPD